ncbi:MAG: protein phosphatase 2C domain-containing protein [Gemmatimonadota bacterium]
MTPAFVPDDAPRRKPLDEEIDVFGITHPGKVRASNADQFLICSLTKKMDVHLTSLERTVELFRAETDRLAFLALVADGVGGTEAGGTASRLAVEAVTRYVSEAIYVYYTQDPTDDQAFVGALTGAARAALSRGPAGCEGASRDRVDGHHADPLHRGVAEGVPAAGG